MKIIKFLSVSWNSVNIRQFYYLGKTPEDNGPMIKKGANKKKRQSLAPKKKQ